MSDAFVNDEFTTFLNDASSWTITPTNPGP